MKDFIDIIKNDKKSKVLFVISLGVLFLCTLSYSLSMFSNSREDNIANIKVNGLSFNMTTNSGESDDRILKLKANTFESFSVVLTNLNSMDVKYELIYEVCSDSSCSSTLDKLPDDISFGVSREVTDSISDTITVINAKNILLISLNNTSQDYYIKLNLNAGYSWNDLVLVNQIEEYHKDIDFIAYVDGIEQSEMPNGCNYNYSTQTYVNGVESTDSVVTLICNRANNTWNITVNKIPNKVKIYFTSKQGTNLVELIESLDKEINGLQEDDFGNLRYAGSSPKNYVTYDDTVFRIIGIFDTDDYDIDGNKLSITSKKVKLITQEIYTGFSFDDYSDGKYTNDYSESSLKEFLETFVPSDDAPCAETTWYLGGWNSAVVTRYDMYNYERGNNVPSGHNTTIAGKIGLMYPSDYGYACKGNSCSASSGLYNYNSSKADNWLYSGKHEWLLTPAKTDTDKVFYLEDAGGINLYHTVSNNFAIRPVVYLYSDVLTSTGDGSLEYPYVIN